MVLLMPEPEDWVAYSRGLHREVWQGIDTTAYLQEERAAWSTSGQ